MYFVGAGIYDEFGIVVFVRIRLLFMFRNCDTCLRDKFFAKVLKLYLLLVFCFSIFHYYLISAGLVTYLMAVVYSNLSNFLLSDLFFLMLQTVL